MVLKEVTRAIGSTRSSNGGHQGSRSQPLCPTRISKENTREVAATSMLHKGVDGGHKRNMLHKGVNGGHHGSRSTNAPTNFTNTAHNDVKSMEFTKEVVPPTIWLLYNSLPQLYHLMILYRAEFLAKHLH